MTNGILDIQTLHGGCPVLVGSKWITNKWIRWKHQQFKFPCPRFGGSRVPSLSNNMCDKPYDNFRCDMKHEILYDNQLYYHQFLKKFTPDFK